MKRAAIIILALLLVLTLFFVVSVWRKPAPARHEIISRTYKPSPENTPPSAAPETAPSVTPLTREEGRSAAEGVTRMITAFHTRMGENPVGTNAEITKALMGGNPVHATFAQDTPKLNAKGELLDPWGTPYFFHQLSGDEMEIHSAGPDKIMGTADDIIVK